MIHTIAIALSGGVDSAVAATLLKDQGHRVIALHFLTGYETWPEKATGTPFEKAHRLLSPLAAQLAIPLHIIDLSREFNHYVVRYFTETYQSGRTPNPCLVCNPAIKFDLLFRKGRELGAERFATGHYARIQRGSDGNRCLLRGLDRQKDQSYFLARLRQVQLANTFLPLGDLTKYQTRCIAQAKGLSAATSGESQDICFIKNASYANFLLNQQGFDSSPGPIEDIHGQQIGNHNGLHHFTIGQRRGINCPAAAPYYVVRIEAQRNCLVVGGKQDLLVDRCRVSHINWISQAAPVPGVPLKLLTRVRYRHEAVPATITPVDAATADVLFDRPEPAVTPGQGAVFYQGEQVIGGGWIE
jgi:tRNA-specific 2-thiouridylase